MTTHIFREYDPQSRKLIIKSSGDAGGSTEDNSSVILHFTYTQADYPAEHVPYIIFDVFDDTGKRAYFSPITSPPFTGYTFAIPYAVTRRATQNKLRYVLAFTVEGEDPERIIEQSALDTLPLTHSFIDALVIRNGLPVDLMPVSGAIKNVTYDDSTSTFTFTRMDDTAFTIELSDLAEDHFEVARQSDLNSLDEAEPGDTATVTSTGVWYKLYIKNGVRTWYVMSGSTRLNGQTTGTPSFYAPYNSGEKNQILLSQGLGKAPVWKSVTKSYLIDFRDMNMRTFAITFPFRPEDMPNGGNIHCTFRDDTGESILLPYRLQPYAGWNEEGMYIITVMCNIPTTVYMDVMMLPSMVFTQMLTR